jgi:hypothetical protein
MVESGSAAGGAARVDQLQQSSKVLVQLREVYRSRSIGSAARGIPQQRSGGYSNVAR